jgi:membrane protease YdiL (CAAX protease family)
VLFTQVPGAVLAIAVVVGVVFFAPNVLPQADLADSARLMGTPVFAAAMMVALTSAQLLGIGFSWLALRLVAGRDWPRQVGLRRPSVAHLALVLASFPAVVLLANGAFVLLREVLSVPSLSTWGDNQSLMEKMVEVFSAWPWPLAVLIVGVGPGLAEELWCRAFLGRGLVGHYGVVAGVVFSSFFFGLIHVDPAQGTMAMLLGLWLHFVYLTTRSLWMPILLHFLNNSLAVTVSRFEALEAIEKSPGELSPYLFVAAAQLLVAVGWVLFRSRARLVQIDGLSLWKPLYPGAEHPPPGSGFRVERPRLVWFDVALVGLAMAGLGAAGIAAALN